MIPRSAKAPWRAWTSRFRKRPALWYLAAILLPTLLLLGQFLSLHLQGRQLDRREQSLSRISTHLREVLQATEQLAERIEQDLHQQQWTMSLMEANLQRANSLSANVPPPLELPLEQAPTP
jgi:hypothetical protein